MFLSLEKNPEKLSELISEIISLANKDKEALGFLPENAYRDAIARKRLTAMIATVAGQRELAGYILFSGVFPTAAVQQISCQPKYRKSGVGAALLNGLVSDLERMGFTTIRARVASNLPDAQRFYQKNGFEVVREVPGGAARERTIIIRVRELETDTLFTLQHRPALALQLDASPHRRIGAEAPSYTFDLNVFFDLVRNRQRHDLACQLFGAALSHRIRLVVAEEFLSELVRTSAGSDSDPVLQMALRLPKLPKTDRSDLQALADKLHDLVFVKPNVQGAGKQQALSDSRHLAHSIIARTATFITSDNAILAARGPLIAEYGLDVASLDEFVGLLPSLEEGVQQGEIVQGSGFEVRCADDTALRAYLSKSDISEAISHRFLNQVPSDEQIWQEAIFENSVMVGVSLLALPSNIDAEAQLLVHVRPEHVDRDFFADRLVSGAVRFACARLPTTVRLLHLPGQSTVATAAKLQGFIRIDNKRDLVKIAVGKPITAENWLEVTSQIRRRAGLSLPLSMPLSSERDSQLEIADQAGAKYPIPFESLERLLSPTIITWPDRIGVIAPIAKVYADELLGTSKQMLLSFVERRDAAFLSRRIYVNSPKTAHIMRAGRPVLFYESVRTDGRGAVVAAARIVDAVVVRKAEIPGAALKKIVVDDVDGLSSTDEVLMTTFTDVLPLPNPVPRTELQRLNALGNANLITAVALPSDKVAAIFTLGWSRG